MPDALDDTKKVRRRKRTHCGTKRKAKLRSEGSTKSSKELFGDDK